ncbi:MAG: alpha/beta hydrolase [Syntrophaceae bacterium]|nr:alpha/beta hydrolase [Syntrophaceae bacterium]
MLCRSIKRIAVLPVFFCVLAGMFLTGCSQESLIFFPEVLPKDYRFAFPTPFQEVHLSADGIELNALHFRIRSPRGVILYFHGNAGSLRTWGEIAPDFTSRGFDLLIPDYRGFGKSGGRLDGESVLLEDALRMYDHLRKEYPEQAIVLYGRSIGTGPATWVASQRKPRMLILESPYTSLADLGAYHHPFLPRSLIRIFLKYPLPTDQWLPSIACPVFLFHGTADDIIPFGMSERLNALATVKHRLIAVPGGGHNDLGHHPFYQQELGRILEVE